MKPLSEQTLYEILEVPDDAPPSEIERAYERVRSIYEPGSLATYTLMAPDEADDLGKRIEEARTVLLDPVARAGYDARLASGTPLPRAGRTDDSTPTVSATAPPGFQQQAPPEIAAPPAPAVMEVAIRFPAALPPQALAAAEPPRAAEAPAQPEPAAPPAQAAAAPVPEAVPAVQPAAAAAEAGAPAPTSPPFAAVERPSATPPPAPRPPEKPVVLPDGVRWTGEQLRKAREARGFTVLQLAEKTRITRHHIENVEADRFEKLPTAVYLRGIVMSLARELRLDGQKVARSYLEHQAASQGKA